MRQPTVTGFTFGPADYAPYIAARFGVALALLGQEPPRPAATEQRDHTAATARCHARTTTALTGAAWRLARSRAAIPKLAEAEAAAMVAAYRALVAGGIPTNECQVVHILLGCACAEQGAHRRYHIHAYNPDRLAAWRARNPAGRVLATFPL